MLVLGIVFLVMAALMHFAGWSLEATLVVVGAGLVVLALVMGVRWPIR
jgi:hypothetical protein